jgi:DNA primase
VYTFVMEMEGLPFHEAVKQLAEQAGVALPDVEADNPAERKKAAVLELYKRVTGSLHYLLLHSETARHARLYLQNRGINQDSLERFQLGYAPADRTWLHSFLTAKGYSPAFLAETGLFSDKDPTRAFFADRVVFPITTTSGAIVAYGARALSDHGPKYLNSRESALFTKRASLFGLSLAIPAMRKQNRFVLAEGYLDVISLHQAGVPYAVAPLGTAFTEEQARLLRRYCEEGILLFDSDEAGMLATKKAIGLCERLGIASKVVSLPNGQDPADILQNQGPSTLLKSLEYRINSFEYLIKSAVSNSEIDSADGKQRVLDQVFPVVEFVDSAVRRDSVLTELADTLQVDRAAVLADFTRREGTSRSRNAAAQPAAKERRPSGLSSDVFLLMAVIVNRQYFPLVRSALRPDDLADARAKELFIALEECFRAEEEALEHLLKRIESQEVRDLVLRKLASDEFTVNSEKLIREAVAQIRLRSIEKQRAAIAQQIRRAERSGGEEDTVRELLAERMYLDKELEKLKVTKDDRLAD